MLNANEQCESESNIQFYLFYHVIIDDSGPSWPSGYRRRLETLGSHVRIPARPRGMLCWMTGLRSTHHGLVAVVWEVLCDVGTVYGAQKTG